MILVDFNIYDWLEQIFIEGIKYILVAHYFLGFEFSRGKKKYLLIIYPVVLLIMKYWNNRDVLFLYYYAWGIVLLIGMFAGKFVEKIKAFFIIWFLIALVDTLIVMVYVMFPQTIFSNQSSKKLVIVGCLGVILWGIMARKGKWIQQYTKNLWKSLSNQEYILSLFVLALGALFVGGYRGVWIIQQP